MAQRDESSRKDVRRDRRAAIGSFVRTGALGLGGILASQSAWAGDSGGKAAPKVDRVLNTKAFGAKGDGVSDDTKAIAACISACGQAGGGTIYFPPGKYVVASTIQVNHSHVSIQGAGWGNTIFAPRIQTGDVFVFGDKSHAPLLTKMADFSIRPSVPMTSGALIHVQNGNGIILSDFEIDGGFHGVSIDDLSLQSGVHVRDFTVDACMIGALGTFTYVSKNLQAWGIMVAKGPSDGYVITNNRSIGNTAGGVHDGGTGKNKTVSGNITVP